VQSLGAFVGLPVNGDWTLQISDDANQDGGQLTAWSLDICLASSVPLPVELLSFDAKGVDDVIHLNWSTGSEENNAGFDIERRAAYERDFSKLATVAPGSADADIRAYSFIDYDVKPGVVYYYRLHQRDWDGSSTLSDVRPAKIDGEVQALQVFPNPTRDVLNGTFQTPFGEDAEVVLSDLSGRILRSITITSQQFTLPVNDLPAGMYTLKAKHSTGEESLRVIIQ
jgi:hypothetical protein